MIIHPPFTPEQVKSINAYQLAGVFHPFTCPDQNCRLTAPRYTPMRADLEGLFCLDCGRTQTWVHDWMTDWRWQAAGVAARGMLKDQPYIEVPDD